MNSTLKAKNLLCTAIMMALVFLSAGIIQASPVVRIVDIDAYDVVYEPFSQRLYASVSSSDPVHGNNTAVINPITATVENSVFVGSEPRMMAVSSDGRYIYIGLYGAGKVCRFDVPSQSVDQEFSLGTGSFGPHYAEDISVQPGNQNVIGVSRVPILQQLICLGRCRQVRCCILRKR